MTPFIAMEFAYENGKVEEEGTERNKKDGVFAVCYIGMT